jgi:protein involved in polysaccharide export with SLBB domain
MKASDMECNLGSHFSRTIARWSAFCLAVIWLMSGLSLAQESTEHLLAAGDTVDIKVFQEPDLDGRVTINKDGKIALSLVGEVTVMGMSTTAAARAIEARYKQGYLVQPKVTVALHAYAKRRFTVLGAVNKPGAFYFPDGETVSMLQAIGMAGGYSRVANPAKVTVKRVGSDAALKVDAKKLAKDTEGKMFFIQPGDVITVGESVF